MASSSFLRIYAITWAETFNTYVVWLMMTYLTDVWKLNFTPAAAIVNLWRGATATLPIFMLYLVDTVTGKFWMILLSTIANSVGLGLLSMSTPPVLPKETVSSCTSYDPNCISHEKRIFFFVSLFLIALGISGLNSSLSSFMRIHDEEEEEDLSVDEKETDLCLGATVVFLIPFAAFASLSFIKPWSIKFGLPAIVTTAATLVFVSGSCQYKLEPPSGSPFTTVLRVFVAAASKRFVGSPNDADQLYEIHATNGDDTHFLPHTHGLSCLDKAATILPNQPLEQQKNKPWKLCRVTEVEETKIAIRCIPMCFSFVICGLVSAIGHTYFISQANHMNRTYGGKQHPLLTLPFLCELWKSCFSYIYKKCGSNKPSKYGPSIGIAASMVLASFCCITAAKVESRRLDAVKHNCLVDKPDAIIPIYYGWLIPQFILLGTMDGFFQNGITGFLTNQVPPSMTPYMTCLSEGIHGVGIISSVLSVFVVGKISEWGGKHHSWFQDTLNKSRLDNYYWTLTGMVSVNLVFYTFMAFSFKYRDASETTVHDLESIDHFSETLQELATQEPD